MAKKQEIQNTVNIGFERQLWNAAEVLWGHIPAADYRKIIVGLIFLRYISTAFERRRQALIDEGEGFEGDKGRVPQPKIFSMCQKKHRWSTIGRQGAHARDWHHHRPGRWVGDREGGPTD